MNQAAFQKIATGYPQIYRIIVSLTFGVLMFTSALPAQHSVARKWNEVLLQAIRGDFARPTVHARNLFYTSIALYDSWAIYDQTAKPYFLSQRVKDEFMAAYTGGLGEDEIRIAREKTMSYAAYRLLMHRFQHSPNVDQTQNRFRQLLLSMQNPTDYESTDYLSGDPAALGNYLAQALIEYGLQDGSNEANRYANLFYITANPPLNPNLQGNPNILNPNRWQTLALAFFIDQSGNPTGSVPPFLSPEWGLVIPFALMKDDLRVYERNGNQYWVYHDPGPPPFVDYNGDEPYIEEYKWGFGLVAAWSSHLDPTDGVMWDISPGAIGNIPPEAYPTTLKGLRNFYKLEEGGDIGQGHQLNPHTGKPYEPQIVPRGDYARVLAEFWADGPDSETPPGHWFTILNYVSDHPELKKKFKGEGEELDDLEWDVKAYLALGGAMHDAAISAWGIKGYYDYIRPVSAIRFMAEQGQGSDPQLPNYSPAGLPLIPGIIERIKSGDSLFNVNDLWLHKIKLKAWKGPNFIANPEVDEAGVGWILADNWWPYQRPSFVTPPFAGYVSGHSTFSRAAAEVLTLLTGDPFFPGGMGEFVAKKNEFLVFEEGPSMDVTLQWATYRDASDQTSLSRIWGGIHPPADDVPGRLIGEKVGIEAFNLAEKYFKGEISSSGQNPDILIYPNVIVNESAVNLELKTLSHELEIQLLDLQGRQIYYKQMIMAQESSVLRIPVKQLSSGLYIIRLRGENWEMTHKIIKR